MDTAEVIFVDEGIDLSTAKQSTGEGLFLFVNETTSAPAFKLGGRQDIRSHVRRNVARNFRQNHKGEKAAREQQGKLVRYPRLAPQRSSDVGYSQHHRRICGLSQVYTSSIPPIESEEFSSNLSAVGSKERNNPYTPVSASAEETSAKIKPNAIHADPDHETIDPFPPTLGEYTPQKYPPVFCPTCGSRLYSTNTTGGNGRGTELAVSRRFRGRGFNHSPVEVLGSGRIDPFLSYPLEKPTIKVHELMDHAVTYLLPKLLMDGDNPANSTLSKAWLSTGLKHPLLFHALVFAGSIHLDFLRTSKIFPNSPHALSHKVTVIHELKEIMKDPKLACRDEVILAILILSSHESMAPSQATVNPFNSPLKKAQWLNVYGSISYVPEHMKAVMELSTIRGGIEKLELYGLAELIAQGDITASTQSLSKPVLPPLRSAAVWIGIVLNWATSPPRSPTPRLGRRFRDLRDYGITEDATSVFDAIIALTIAIDYYLDGETACLSIQALANGRSAIQRRLLSLATAEDIDRSSPTKLTRPNIYETCRLAALIYGVAIIYPIPNSYNVLQSLVRSLKAAIEVCDFDQLGSILPDFLLWILVLGGIAALDKPERNWYVTQLARVVKKRHVYGWDEVEEGLSAFLWLDSACGPGGQRLWSEVMETIYILESLDSHE